MVRNYLKAETPPWFWETCAEAFLYAYRYTFSGYLLALSTNRNKGKKNKTLPLPEWWQIFLSEVRHQPSFQYSRSGSHIVSRGIISSEPLILFLQHSFTWASKDLNQCQNSRWIWRTLVSIVLFSSAFLCSRINPLSFHGGYISVLTQAGCSARNHWKETHRKNQYKESNSNK